MFVSLWVPPPVWLNCPSLTPIIIIYPPLYIYTYKAVCLLVCGSPPPVWLNCLSQTPIIIIYPPSPLQFYISSHCCSLFILSLYVYIISVSCQVAFTIFRICIFEIILLIFKKSLSLSYILRSDNLYNHMSTPFL